MSQNNFYKHKYMQGMNCSCILHECLANLNSLSVTLTTLFTFIVFKMWGNVVNTL